MKIPKVFSFLVLTVITAAGTAAVVVWRVHAQSTSTTAFHAIQREVFYKIPGGEYSHVQTSEFSRKTDGSEVEIRTNPTPKGEVKPTRIIIDLDTKTRTVVDEITESLTTTYFSDQEVSDTRQRLSACTIDPLARPGNNILGYITNKTVREVSAAGRKARVESWRVPKLGCFPLKQETYIIGQDGAAVLSSVREVLSVTEGNPPPTGFAIPANFTERAPSAVMAEYNRRYPDAPAPVTGLGQRDMAYFVQRQKQ